MSERLSRRSLLGFVGAVVGATQVSPAFSEDDPWPGLQQDVFGNRPIVAEDGLVALEAPVRAEDAALVPVTVRVAGGAVPRTLTLLVDRNPAPVVATFTFGEGAGEMVLATRIRVDTYSNLRAVVELEDGSLHMATKYVKASGGCSAPALKDSALADAELGKMRLRQFAAGPGSTSREAQLMIRHPNHSGLQMNQLTGYYIPAKFIADLEVRRGGALVFRMEGGISLSADPNIRFSFRPGGEDEVLAVVAKDTDGRVLHGNWPVKIGNDS